MRYRIAHGAVIILFVFLTGCGGVRYPVAAKGTGGDPSLYSLDHEYGERVLRLKKDLERLSNDIREADALLVADTAIRISMVLANEYELVRPPLWHNHLVNQGLRRKGLCVDWTKDLLKYLRALNQKSFEFHWGVAHRDKLWRFHSCAVVSAKGQAFENGLVLDPWRNSGRLYWISVKEDRYPWKLEPGK